MLTTFTQQYTAHPNINATVVANDANGNAVISQLKTLADQAQDVPDHGPGRAADAVQNILAGYQCMTVYKPIYLEAQAAVALALYLRAGQTPPVGLVNGTTKDTTAKTDVQSVLLTPLSVDTSNMASTVVKDNFVTASDDLHGLVQERSARQAGIPTS